MGGEFISFDTLSWFVVGFSDRIIGTSLLSRLVFVDIASSLHCRDQFTPIVFTQPTLSHSVLVSSQLVCHEASRKVRVCPSESTYRSRLQSSDDV